MFVRAHEGDELTRAEVFMLNNFVDQFLNTISYELALEETRGTQPPLDNRVKGLQLYTANRYFKRRWEAYNDTWEAPIVALVDRTLENPDQRDVLAYLDYIRGATDQLE